MITEIDTKELLREIAIKLDSTEDFRLGEVWLGLLRRAAIAIAQLQQQIETERHKVNFLVGQNRRLIEESAAERDAHRAELKENFTPVRVDEGVI